MVTAVLFRLVSDSEDGKSDARLAQAQTSASTCTGRRRTGRRGGARRSPVAPARRGAGAGAAPSPRSSGGGSSRRGGAQRGAARARRRAHARAGCRDGGRRGGAGVNGRDGPAGTLRVSVRPPAGSSPSSSVTGLEVALTLDDRGRRHLGGTIAATGRARGARRDRRQRLPDASFDGASPGDVRVTLLADQRDARKRLRGPLDLRCCSRSCLLAFSSPFAVTAAARCRRRSRGCSTRRGARPRRPLRRGPDGGQRRVRRARLRVQPHGPPAQGPPGRAGVRARAGADRDPPAGDSMAASRTARR